MLDTDDEIIIDNYAEKEILDDLNTINKKSNNYFIKYNINDSLKNKYLKQYSNDTFCNYNSYHNRFIIVDRKRVFYSRAFFKDIEKKFCHK